MKKHSGRVGAILQAACSMALTVALGVPLLAEAKWVRRAASTCDLSLYAHDELFNSVQYKGSNGEVINYDSDRPGDSFAHHICDLNDTSYMPHTTFATLNVHVLDLDNAGRSGAMVCHGDYNNSTSGDCSSYDFTSTAGTGEDTLTPTLSVISGAPSSHFVHLRVFQDPSSALGKVQVFRGFYLAD